MTASLGVAIYGYITALIAQISGDIQTTQESFTQIYTAFLVLGTIVGIIVIAYLLYNTYKYWEKNDGTKRDKHDMELGELPTGGGGGKKLFLSFSLSAIIVISLVSWTYVTLLYYDEGPDVSDSESMDIEVEGYQFGWRFIYPDGDFETTGTLVVPEDEVVNLRVTSTDVFHNFGIPKYKKKTDAIPGRYTDMWIVPEETGTYRIVCYELCGTGHSFMTGEIQVMEQEEFNQWYQNQTEA